MRKEVSFAIVMGIAFGLVVAFGIIRANRAINKSSSQAATSNETGGSEQLTQVAGLEISLTKPQNISVETENPIAVSGISKPETWIVISSEGDNYLTKTNDKGEFSQNIKLYGGLNQIVIVAVAESGETSSKQASVVYSTEFKQEADSTEEAEGIATEEAEGIEGKVNQKIEEALNRATFYSGTITDITNSTFQLKSDDGEIRQVSVLDSANFVKLGKTTSSLKFEDIAIGDYILALGYINNKNVLASSRVLVTAPSQLETPTIVIGSVSVTKKGQITIASAANDKESDVVATNDTLTTSGDVNNPKKVKFSSIEEGDGVIIIGIVNDLQIEASRVHIISIPEPSPS